MRNDTEPVRRALLDDSDSDPEDGGAKISTSELQVNKEYAKKFEHNKKREELHRRKELYIEIV